MYIMAPMNHRLWHSQSSMWKLILPWYITNVCMRTLSIGQVEGASTTRNSWTDTLYVHWVTLIDDIKYESWQWLTIVSCHTVTQTQDTWHLLGHRLMCRCYCQQTGPALENTHCYATFIHWRTKTHSHLLHDIFLRWHFAAVMQHEKRLVPNSTICIVLEWVMQH